MNAPQQRGERKRELEWGIARQTPDPQAATAHNHAALYRKNRAMDMPAILPGRPVDCGDETSDKILHFPLASPARPQVNDILGL